jgi:flagellar hook-basal body complex protein FliE
MHNMTANPAADDQVHRTSVSMPFETSVRLNEVKLAMSRAAGRMVTLPEVVDTLITAWEQREQP